MEGIRIGQFSLVSNKGKHHYDCYDQNGKITGHPVTQGIAREIEILQIKNEELKEKQTWINVKDRLPEEDKLVLVAKIQGSMSGMNYINPGVGFNKNGKMTGGMDWVTVTHWMELPKNPEKINPK
jgi:hypothetical protein